MENQVSRILIIGFILFIFPLLGFNHLNAQSKIAKLKIIPLKAEFSNDNLGAFLLPSDWEGQGVKKVVVNESMYDLNAFSARSNRGSLRYEDLGNYIYTAMHASMGVDATVNPRFVPYQGIELYNAQYVLPMVHQGYQITAQKPLPDFFRKSTEYPGFFKHAYLNALVSSSDPNRVAFMITITEGLLSETMHNWKGTAFLLEGEFSDSEHLLDVAYLIGNSLETSPTFISTMNQCNLMIKRNMEINFEILQNTLREVNSSLSVINRSTTEYANTTRNSTMEQFSDMLLDVETYRDPTSGEEYSMPNSNQYYYSNSMGDFIATDNPLFDPNSNLSTIYNWTKLEKKY